MKRFPLASRFGFVFLLSLAVHNLPAQRYLSPVFPGTDVTTDIPYGAATNYQGLSQVLLLDFYQPQGDTLAARPLIIYVHGGGFTDVTQTKLLPHITSFADSMARRGYAVASIDYRLDSTISNRAVIHAMHDAKASVRFFRANASQYRIDTSLIFIGGESAGAVTALNTNYVDQLPEIQSPATLPLSTDQTLEGNSGNPGFGSETKATLCYCGGTRTLFGAPMFDTLAMQAATDPPLLQLHGTLDPLIPIAAGLDVAVRATHLGLPNLFYALPGATHCPWYFALPNSAAYLDTLIDYTVPFLYACLQTSTDLDAKVTASPLNIVPHPNAGRFRLFIPEPGISRGTISIFDAQGKMVFQSERHFPGQQTEIDLGNLAKGLYSLQLRGANRKIWRERLLIQ